jgi:hypothetical protein
MDNFFDILIYILIIAIFLSSLFRKKKVPPKEGAEGTQRRPGPDNRPVTKVETTSTTPKQDSGEVEFDLFKEFENFLNPVETKPKPQQTEQTPPVQEMKKTREDYIPVPEKSFHEETASEHTYVDKWERKKKEIDQRKKTINSKIEKEATQFEELLKKDERTGEKLISSFNKKFKDASSLREYVIFSEILGKPKALKRWNRRSIS